MNYFLIIYNLSGSITLLIFEENLKLTKNLKIIKDFCSQILFFFVFLQISVLLPLNMPVFIFISFIFEGSEDIFKKFKLFNLV